MSPAGGDVTLEGVEVANAGWVGHGREQGRRPEGVFGSGLLAALAGEPGEHRRRLQHMDCLTLDRSDTELAGGIAESGHPHGVRFAQADTVQHLMNGTCRCRRRTAPARTI
jgi:hypothetical protein